MLGSNNTWRNGITLINLPTNPETHVCASENQSSLCEAQSEKRPSNGGGGAIVIAKDQQRTQKAVYGAQPDQRRPSPQHSLQATCHILRIGGVR